ncbi:uncharacterized protein LOC121992843 isoform X2 [Zingiber officinale]|uniref:uncharacterized protein LOC121992843 isoform X2 n=1 Tax=Zingiber officinale TaxID=94328 RepID=UPI001C4DD510|nr:uncharacterized protein LOC121992843 isoform X2 [Zingiber officinale]XP_042403376.1 uncharacterized protein LOC121992843 isoform X2 [Zingiber officinale]
MILSASEQIHALRVPEANVTLSQVDVKVNRETEKYIPGWSLFSQCKVQSQKCEKCSRDFCSTINYRRHVRLHRRSLNIAKDFLKNRVLLGEYWDRLPIEEAKDILSLKDAVVEGVTGSFIIKELTNFIQNLGLLLLPHVYVKAGATLLDIVEGSSFRFPLSSQDLFNLLDDASERTFLHAGNALFMQKYIFNGDAEKISIEAKNLVAFASFMLEQKLVKSWHAEKDIEALRLQCLLMEEEEIAKKRQTELEERKRLKKLRQKERKMTIATGTAKNNSEPYSHDSVRLTCRSTETSSPIPTSVSCFDTCTAKASPKLLCVQPTKYCKVEPHLDCNMFLHSPKEVNVDFVDQKMENKSCECQLTPISGQILLTQIPPSSCYHDEAPFAKSPTTSTNDLIIGTQKTKPEKDGNEINSKCEVLIGSISVDLGNGSPLVVKHSKLAEHVSSLNSANLMDIKPPNPCCHDIVDSAVEQIGAKFNELHAHPFNHIPVENACGNGFGKCLDSIIDLDSSDLAFPRLFSSHTAKAFLAERWKESMMTDHVTLALPSDTEL